MIPRKLCLLALFLIAIDSSTATLSKSDRKANKDDAKPPPKTESSKPASSISNDLTKESIIKNHKSIDRESSRHFNGLTLAYVTPWNNRGYDIAKWQAKKFDVIVPVWFQALPSGDSCEIKGSHDIDRGWMDDIRKGNADVQFMPRINFEQFQPDQLNDLLSKQAIQENCATTIVDFLQRNEFDGATIELWLMMMAMTRGQAVREIMTFVISIAELLHSRDMRVVLPVSPPLSEDAKTPTGIFMPDHLRALLPHIDYFSMMTYDYSQGKPGPVAPLGWQIRNMAYLLDGNEEARSKLLMGVNMYGYAYEPNKQPQPIVGNRFIELLKQPDAQLQFDDMAMEHYLKTGSLTANYPSTTSLQHRYNAAANLGVGMALWDIGQGLDYFYNDL